MPTSKLPDRLALLALPLLTFAALLAVLADQRAPARSRSGGSARRGGRPAPRREDTAARSPALRAAVADDPADAADFAALGDAYYQRARETGDPAYIERAERAYDTALAADPGDVAALSGQATVALARHDFAGGLELARRAHRLAPASVAPYAALVDGLIETGRYGAAARALDRMVR